MDLKQFSGQYNDNSNYLFCHKVSYFLRVGPISFLLNILVNANFKGISFQRFRFTNSLANQSDSLTQTNQSMTNLSKLSNKKRGSGTRRRFSTRCAARSN